MTRRPHGLDRHPPLPHRPAPRDSRLPPWMVFALFLPLALLWLVARANDTHGWTGAAHGCGWPVLVLAGVPVAVTCAVVAILLLRRGRSRLGIVLLCVVLAVGFVLVDWADRASAAIMAGEAPARACRR
jgi:hypothetical protein